MDKVLYSCFLLLVGISAQLDVGDHCNFDILGKCTLLEGCPIADKLIRNRIRHTFKRCGWKGRKEIICCPLPEDLDRNRPRKIKEVCSNYAKKYSTDVQSFIYGGLNASLGEFPYMAAIGYEKELGDPSQILWECGGSLINENFVLTAAHCVLRSDRKLPVMVRLGKVDILGNDDNVEAQDIRVAKTYPHPEYSGLRHVNDIGLLRLEKAVHLTDYVKPVCLYTKNDTPQGLFVTGWGQTENGTSSRFLLKAPMKPVELVECQPIYARRYSTYLESQFCARSGQDIPSDTCQGDSGGPIQVVNRLDNNATPYIVIGVTSFGPSCGGTTPSVYTRIYDYLDWIESIVWPDE